MVGASFKTVKGPPNLSPDSSSSTKLCLLGRIFRPGEKARKLPRGLYLTNKKPGTAGRDPAVGFGIRENQALALTTSYLGSFKQVI